MARLLAIVIVTGLAACQTSQVSIPMIGSKLSDSEQIAFVLDDAHRGMETRRIYKVMAHVSRSYRDQEGRDYESMQAYLTDFFDRYPDIRITRARPRIIIRGNQAEAIETFGTRAEASDESDIDIHLQGQVTVYLRKENGVWKIVEWGPLQ